MPKDKMSIQFAPLVINTGGKLVVVDTGNGAAAFASSKGNVGQFGANMVAAGFDPKAVDMVVISHFHGDHINGLLTAENTPVFPNAEVLVPAAEWKYFMDDGEMSRAPEGRMQTVFKNARRVFEAGLKKKATPYEWGKEVAPGLTAVETIGHTPGHTSYVLASGSDKVFIQSDVTNLPALFVANPGWHLLFDQDPALAEKTRRRVYDMLVADKMRVQGFHYPFPANGFVEKDGSGYRRFLRARLGPAVALCDRVAARTLGRIARRWPAKPRHRFHELGELDAPLDVRWRSTGGEHLVEFAFDPHFIEAAGHFTGAGEFRIPAATWRSLSPGLYFARAVGLPAFDALARWRFVKSARESSFGSGSDGKTSSDCPISGAGCS
jgi:glyoxylase-like metal-dependent hydrolase (beta-lactamase superfamily II)